MKPKLYQYTACPFCNKVGAMLEFKNVDYEKIEVHPLKKTEIAFSEYRAVPIYIDSHGVQVNDSTPILRHIDEEFPQHKVFRDGGTEKEKEEKWLKWSETLVQCLPTVIYQTFPKALRAFDYITQVGKFGWWESRSVKWTGAFVMSLVAKKIKKRLSIENPEMHLRNLVQEWSREALADGPYCGGGRPNAADIAVYGISRTVAGLNAGDLFREDSKYWNWFQKMAEQVKAPASAVV